MGWQGEGCSISQASISVMHDLVDGADLATVARLSKDFDVLMHSRGRGVDDAVLDALEDGAAFEGVSKYPNRVKCALLGWMALKDALAKSGVALPAAAQVSDDALVSALTEALTHVTDSIRAGGYRPEAIRARARRRFGEATFVRSCRELYEQARGEITGSAR